TSDHLERCDECYERFNTEDRTAATYSFVRKYLAGAPESGTDHLLYEQMAGYADGRLDGSEAEGVKSHIKECGECDSDLSDLLRIKEHLAKGDAARPAWSKAVGSTATGRAQERAASSAERPSRGVPPAPYWQSPGYRLALQAACLVIVIGVAVWVST